MTLEELLKEVEEFQPEMMAKTAQVIALSDKLAPEFTKDIFRDFEVIFETIKEKTAEVSQSTILDTAKRVGVLLGSSVAAGVMSSAATDLYDAARRGLTKSRNFKRIMEANPSLKRELNKKDLTMAFNAIHRFAPDMTSDPLVGGSLLRIVAELPGQSYKTMQDIISTQSNINNAKSKHFQEVSKLAPLMLKNDKSEGRETFEDFKKKEDYREKLRSDSEDRKEYKKNQGSSSPF
jgi:hypothetical protein